MEETEVVQTKKRPAITINVQSWATPIVGVVMLIVGLLGGYYGRPLVGDGGEQAAVPHRAAEGEAGGVVPRGRVPRGARRPFGESRRCGPGAAVRADGAAAGR